jgi:hypothetical protein
MKAVRGQLAELSRVKTFNDWMGTGLLTLDEIPIETVELVLAWAAEGSKR